MWSEVALTGLWLAVAVVLSLVLALLNSPLVPLPGLITLLLVPGAGVMSMLQTRPANTGGRLALAVSLSMMVIMVVGGAASLLGPHIGLAHPLNSIPEVVIWSFLAIVLLVISAIKHCDPVGWIFETSRNHLRLERLRLE